MTEDLSRFDEQVDDIISEFISGNRNSCHVELDRHHHNYCHHYHDDGIPDDDDPLTYEDDIGRIVSDMLSKEHKHLSHRTIVRKQQCPPPPENHDDCGHIEDDPECDKRSVCEEVIDSEADRQLEESIRAKNEKLRIQGEICRESRMSDIENDLKDKIKNGYFDGPPGQKGDPGDPGVSPVITTSKVGTVTTISITDAIGTHTVEINDGESGSLLDPISESFILAL